MFSSPAARKSADNLAPLSPTASRSEFNLHSTHKPPTARDIPPVTLTNIPHVDASEFKPYLSQVGALYEQLRRVKEAEDENDAGRRGSKPDDATETDEGRLRPGSRSGRRPSITSLNSLTSSMDASGSLRRTSTSQRGRASQGPPPLATIPNVYFDDDFHLENPRTFDVVSERSEVVRPAPGTADDKTNGNGNAAAPRKALATNAILQEKLSWYMDTIEMHLINSISTASTTFFTALGSLRELHSEAAESVDRITTLRKELQALDAEIAQSGLDIVQKKRRRENLQQLNDAVLQLRHIVEGVAHCEAAVDNGEVEQALGRIDALELLIAGETSAENRSPAALKAIQLRDLRGATALQGVHEDLNTLRSRIGKAYETNLVNVLLTDLRRHLDTVSQQEVLLRWGSASMRGRGGHAREPSAFPSYMASTEELRAAILPNLVGLHRAQHIAVATSVYREAVLREVKNIIRRPLPSSNDDDNASVMSASTMSGGRGSSGQERSSILARNLRALDPPDAEELLKSVYVGVTETLRRVTTQVKVLLDIASSLSASSASGLMSPQFRSPLASPNPDRQGPKDFTGFEIQEEIHQAMDVSNLMGQGVDIAQDKIIKVLKVRGEQSSSLPLIWFLRYFSLNLFFANECEAISGRSGTALKTIVNGHINQFVLSHGDVEKQKLAQGMESDQWNAKDFGERETLLLDRVLESSTRDAAAWSDGTKIWIEYSLEDEVNGNDTSVDANGTSKEKVRPAVIEGENFLLPNSAVLCLDGISSFLHLIAGIPSMTVDVATSLVAYLHLFNSRCTQLILGAGATRSAGLKNITTRHLALASQALALVVTLIPHIREFVRRHAGSGAGVSSLMGEFDKVRRLFQEHQNSIYDKLVEIMSGRASQHSKTMKRIDWDADNAAPVHGYMETLAKETTTLHRVLTKHLPEGSVQMIMGPVFSSYKTQFGTVFEAAEPRTEAGRDSMRRDVDLLVSKLGKIEGFDSVGKHLMDIVNAKKIEGPPPPKPPAAEEKPKEEEKPAEDGDKAEAGNSGKTSEEGKKEEDAA
ncbi:vacuolar protein sorting-associated protein [Plectosphaerella plurivora]|uniref:Vacuolar protein sorting-associated protein 54 n=1 Tax=Plectosphaerella plurivora TaxID=936078 RepID=A0A9P9AAE7_9PEZI|nr:vacuolar protein sorting-associated protein [Plectosphaerella plurivora]